MELTALALGFMGSLHCVGMCSPLAMVATRGTVLRNRFLYHAGRIVTYGIFGMLVSGFGALLSFSNVQNVISITLGIALLAAGIFGTSGIRVPLITPALTKLTVWLKLRFSGYLQRRNARAVLLMGMLNGILPCGLVYLALGYCLTLASWHDGLLFMILFGAGTLPALLIVPALLTAFTNRLHFTMRRAVTVLFILSGSVLIARGVLHHVHVPQATDLSAHPTDIPVCR